MCPRTDRVVRIRGRAGQRPWQPGPRSPQSRVLKQPLALHCRYQKTYRELAKKHPSFRERSETTELIVEISLQPWNSFKPDGVILFSDILTPLPGVGVNFDIDDNKGPIIDTPIRSLEQVRQLHEMDFSKVDFVGRYVQPAAGRGKRASSCPC